MNQKGFAPILLVLLLGIVLIGGYLIFTKGSFFLSDSSKIKFDLDKHLKITLVDAVTNKGVEGVPIHFLNNCLGPEIASNDPTCGGKYEQVPSGKTNSDGVLLIIMTTKTPPPGVLHFQLGMKFGYNTDIGTGSFVWEDGTKSEVTYKIAPSLKSSEAVINDANSAIAAVEADKNFRTWKSNMEKVEKPNADIRSGQWRVYYQGIKKNTGDWLITFYVDPQTGKVTSYEEPIQRVLTPSARYAIP